MSETKQTRYILAEYCSAQFYTGWWLYRREHNNGQPNTSGSWWGWLRDDVTQKRVFELLRCMGESPPEVGRYSQTLAKWFAVTFPNGLRVEGDEWGPYSLVEICANRPRQRRGHIRTVRGAAAADRRTKAMERGA